MKAWKKALNGQLRVNVAPLCEKEIALNGPNFAEIERFTAGPTKAYVSKNSSPDTNPGPRFLGFDSEGEKLLWAQGVRLRMTEVLGTRK